MLAGCPCPACSGRLSRAYLRHLVRQHELTGLRLLTLHNLTFVGSLMARLRAAIGTGELAGIAADLRAGGSPFA